MWLKVGAWIKEYRRERKEYDHKKYVDGAERILRGLMGELGV